MQAHPSFVASSCAAAAAVMFAVLCSGCGGSSVAPQATGSPSAPATAKAAQPAAMPPQSPSLASVGAAEPSRLAIDANDSSRCFEARLMHDGTVVETTMTSAGTGSPAPVRTRVTMTAGQMFAGTPMIEGRTEMRLPDGTYRELVRSYYTIDDRNVLLHGEQSTQLRFRSPALPRPIAMRKGETVSYESLSREGGPSGDVVESTKGSITFEGFETINVLHGSREACRFSSHEQTKYGLRRSKIDIVKWVLADGEYRGLEVRQRVEVSDGPVEVTQRLDLSQVHEYSLK